MKREILSRLILQHVKVTWEGKVGNNTQFVTYKMTFWLALPSWLLKVPIIALYVSNESGLFRTIFKDRHETSGMQFGFIL